MSGSIAGGYYYDSLTKKYHDAWGHPVAQQGEAAIKKSKDETEALTPDQAELLGQQNKAERAAMEARAALDKAEAAAKVSKIAPPRAAKRTGKKGK